MGKEKFEYNGIMSEAAVGRAEEVVGHVFHRNPNELQNPLYFGVGMLDRQIQKGNKEIKLKHGDVEFVGQGPLPVTSKGQEYMVTAAAFRINGDVGHEAIGIFHRGQNPNGEYPLYAVIEDHVSLVVQAEGGGSLWAQMDGALNKIFESGGGVVLLPSYMKSLSRKEVAGFVRSMGKLSGSDRIRYIDHLDGIGTKKARMPISKEELIKIVDKKYLSNVTISNAEYVMLPFSEKPFVHLEVVENSDPHNFHHVWIYGDVKNGKRVPMRPHSACSSSEVLGASNCDCPEQLDAAFRQLVDSGFGVVTYLNQEARGHGVWAKVQTWHLNIGEKIDLITAFNAAGLAEDVREFGIVKKVLDSLGIESIVLMSNNGTVKGQGLLDEGVNIVGMMSIHPDHTEHQSEYLTMDLEAKKNIRGDQFHNPSVVKGKMKLVRH